MEPLLIGKINGNSYFLGFPMHLKVFVHNCNVFSMYISDDCLTLIQAYVIFFNPRVLKFSDRFILYMKVAFKKVKLNRSIF